MQIRTLATGKDANLLQLTEARLGEAQVIETDRQAQLPQQWQELSMRLRCQAIPAKAFLKAKLHQDAESHLLPMESVMASLKLGETVVDRVGRHRATTGSAETAHNTGGQRTGLRRSNPSRTGGIIETQARQIPPLHLGSQGLGLRVKQSRLQMIQERLQWLMGLSSAAPTRASSKAPGVTEKGR